MPSKAVTKPAASVEAREQHASAEAKAGLNLNLVAALSGSLFSRSKKTTHGNPDGSSHSVEETDTAAMAQGRGAANMNAIAAAKANTSDKRLKERQVDHLGIEG